MAGNPPSACKTLWLSKVVYGKPIVAIFICHAGKVEDGETWLQPLRVTGKPIADIVTRRPYVQMQSLLDATQPKGRRYYWKSHYLARIEWPLIDAAVAHHANIASPHSAILMFQVDGALGDLSRRAFAGRQSRRGLLLNIAGSWAKPEDHAVNMKWARDCF